jgi:early secretory antigenic target protein ESAT-6
VSDSYTSANFGVLSSSAENFAIVAGTLQKELDELESSLQQKLAQWDGNARHQYTICKRRWDAAAADMQRVIQKLGLAIGNAHENYAAAEKYGANLFS